MRRKAIFDIFTTFVSCYVSFAESNAANDPGNVTLTLSLTQVEILINAA
jgi:hypothetical protein